MFYKVVKLRKYYSGSEINSYNDLLEKLKSEERASLMLKEEDHDELVVVFDDEFAEKYNIDLDKERRTELEEYFEEEDFAEVPIIFSSDKDFNPHQIRGMHMMSLSDSGLPDYLFDDTSTRLYVYVSFDYFMTNGML